MMKKIFVFLAISFLAFFYVFLGANKVYALSCSITTTQAFTGYSTTSTGDCCTNARNACTASGDSCNNICSQGTSSCNPALGYCEYSCGTTGTTGSTWTCPSTYCSGTTYYYGTQSCGSSYLACVYGNSQANSPSCGAGGPTPTPPPSGTPCDTCSGSYGACSATCGAGTQTCTLDTYTAGATDDPCTVRHGGAYYYGGACNTENTMLYQCAGTANNGAGYSTSHQNCNCIVNTNGAYNNGWDYCNGAKACTQGTSSQSCTGTPPVDGGWSGWSGWSDAAGNSDGGGGTCSKSCGTGTQTRTRACNNPAPNSCGAACSGSTSETQNCNTQSCVVIIAGKVYIDYAGNCTVGPGVSGVNVSDGVDAQKTTDANGDYTISNVTPGTYTVSITKPAGYNNITCPVPYPPTVYATNPSNTQNFGIQPSAPTCTMTANPTLVQTGKTAVLTASYSLANVVTGTPTYTWYPDTSGATITGASINTGTKKITATWNAPLPPYYQQSTAYPSIQICNPSGGLCGSCGMPVATPPACTLNVSCPITIIPTFTASGQVYVDQDKNGVLNKPVDTDYTGGALVSICQVQGGNCNPYGGTLTTASNGTFITGGANPLLTPGTYKATLTVPSPYQPITPKPPTALFTVGNASTRTPCSVPAYAGCDANGNAININFGISDSFVWMQAIGGDITGTAISDPNQGGFTNTIPASANITNGACSGSATGPYTMINGAGGTHGLINTGFKDATFGQGQLAAAQAWLVGGSAGNSYTYNMPLSKQTKTAYANLSYLVKQSNITPTPLTDIPSCISTSNCTLPTDPAIITAKFPSSIYTVAGDLTLNGTGSPQSYTFPNLAANKSYIILVNGNININTKIVVPVGSFVLFSASGDINVAATVGDTYNIATSNLEGYYSTDKSFNILGKNISGNGANCATTNNEDLRLNVAGSIIVNASTINGGSFNYSQRDMCAYDKQCPVFTISERPDFILNSPTFLMFPRRLWQEVAP